MTPFELNVKRQLIWEKFSPILKLAGGDQFEAKIGPHLHSVCPALYTTYCRRLTAIPCFSIAEDVGIGEGEVQHGGICTKCAKQEGKT